MVEKIILGFGWPIDGPVRNFAVLDIDSTRTNLKPVKRVKIISWLWQKHRSSILVIRVLNANVYNVIATTCHKSITQLTDYSTLNDSSAFYKPVESLQSLSMVDRSLCRWGKWWNRRRKWRVWQKPRGCPSPLTCWTGASCVFSRNLKSEAVLRWDQGKTEKSEKGRKKSILEKTCRCGRFYLELQNWKSLSFMNLFYLLF